MAARTTALRSRVLQPGQSTLSSRAHGEPGGDGAPFWSQHDPALFTLTPASLASLAAAVYTTRSTPGTAGCPTQEPLIIASPTAPRGNPATSISVMLTTHQIMQMAHHFVDRANGADEAGGSNSAPATVFAPPSCDFEPLLVCLGSMFGRALGPAMRILANAPAHIVILFTRNTRRTLYRVSGHECFGPWHCSCSSFKFSVASKGEAQHCKHILALFILHRFDPRFPASLVFPEGLEARIAESQSQSGGGSFLATRHPSVQMSPVVSAALLGSRSSGGADAGAPPALINYMDEDGFTWTEVSESTFAALVQSPVEPDKAAAPQQNHTEQLQRYNP